MAALYGAMGLADVKNLSVQQLGQRVVFDAVNTLLAQYNADLAAITDFFVARTTEEVQITYFMPGGGEMQESTEWTRPGAVRPPAGYPVGFEINDARDQVAWNDIALAYATVETVQAAVDNIMIRHTNWVRRKLLRAVLNNVNRTTLDPQFGSVTVKPLANGDTDVYSMYGAAMATDNHYIASNMASISDANNPFPTYYEEIAEHVGDTTVVALVNPAQAAQIKAMAAFIDVADTRVRVSDGIEAINPGISVPGSIIGLLGNTWISEWRAMPAGYTFVRNMDVPAPLLKRIDRVPIDGRGELRLIATQQEFPLQESFWRDRHGYGAENRVAALVGQITGAAYVIPAGYA